MGATGTAYSDTYESVYANPAGLAHATTRRLVLGFVFGRYGLTLDGAAREVRETNGLVLGASLPLPLGGVMKDRLSLGLGFHLPAGLVNSARAPFPEQPYLALLDNRTQTVTIMVGGGARLPRGVSIGVGILALAALRGVIYLDADATGRITSRSDQQLVTHFAAILGLRAEVHPRVRLGAVYRGESIARQEVRVAPNLRTAIPFDIPMLTVAGTSQYDPHQVAIELAVLPGAGITLALQGVWKHWSDYPFPSEPVTQGAPPPPRPDFRDTIEPRLGFEWRREWTRLELALRAGYALAMTPARDVSPERTAIDADRHVITAGFELALRHQHAPLRLGTFFQWHQLQPNERVSGGFAAGGVMLGFDFAAVPK